MDTTANALWDGGYSPPISAHILIHGERFNVASMGGNRLILKDPRPVPPGRAALHFIIDGNLAIYHLDLIEGIDPARRVQPYLNVKTNEEAVA